MSNEPAYRRLIKLFYKLHELERMLNQIVIGQPRYVRALITGLASKEHVALISPPGTAKSYLVRNLAKAIDGAEFYMTLLNPYITYDELFGPLDIRSLVGEGEQSVKRRWSKLVKSHFAFLDEGFKANPALLNSLLSLLNERLVYDPFTGSEVHSPLIMAVVASNEVPMDESLRALWDRIVIRVFSNYPTNPETVGEIIESYWRRKVPVEKFLKLEEVREINKLVEHALRDPSLSSLIGAFLSQGAVSDYLALYRYMVMYPLLILHKNGAVTVSTRTLTQKLPKIYLVEVLLNKLKGMPDPLAHYEALLNIAAYLSPDQDSVEQIVNAMKSLLAPIEPIMDEIRKAYQALREARKNPEKITEALGVLRRLANLESLSVAPIEDNVKELTQELSRLLNYYGIEEEMALPLAMLYIMAKNYAERKLASLEKQARVVKSARLPEREKAYA